ncbi:nitrate reductase, partial [Vibrio diabolicus]
MRWFWCFRWHAGASVQRCSHLNRALWRRAKMDKIVELIKQDPIRVEALKVVSQLALPQCYIA